MWCDDFSAKRWDEALERPNLDYSEIFDEDVGQVPGGFVLQRFAVIWNLEVSEIKHDVVLSVINVILLNSVLSWYEVSNVCSKSAHNHKSRFN